jgi:hypothetical protein
MAPAGFYIGVLLAGAAVGLIVIFALAAGAVFVIGPRRQDALTAPVVAAGAAGLTALFVGSDLRLDATAVIGITALSAVVVTIFQRLREAERDTTAWAIGLIGGQACIGAGQGLFFGALASVIGHDARLLWILIPTGAAIRGAWAFFARDRGPAVALVPSTPPETSPDARVSEPDGHPVNAALATGNDDALAAADAETPPPENPARDTPPPADGGTIGMPLKLIGAGVVVLFAFAAIAFLSVPRGSDKSQVTVFNRTETPVALKPPYGTVVAFVPACATVSFETSGQAWVAQSPAPAGSAVPPDAVQVEVNVDRLIPRGAEAPPPAEWEVLIASDREQGGPPGTWSGSTAAPPCAGPARTSIDLSGTGNTTTAPFRLAGSYQRSVVVTAPAAERCSFTATITGGDAPETIVEPFDAAPGTEPRFPASATYTDGSYELSVTSTCSWSVTFVP